MAQGYTRERCSYDPYLLLQIVFLKLLDALAHQVQSRLLKKIGDGLPTTGQEVTRVWTSGEQGNVPSEQIRPLRRNDLGQIRPLLDPDPEAVKETVAVKCIPQNVGVETLF